MAKTSRFGGIASFIVFLNIHPKNMAVYYINSYDIIHPDYQNYPPQVSVLLKKYGAEVLAVDTAAIAVEGQPRTMNAIIKFPSEEAALQCYNDPEYEPMKALRHRTTANATMIIVKEFAGRS